MSTVDTRLAEAFHLLAAWPQRGVGGGRCSYQTSPAAALTSVTVLHLLGV